MNHKLEQIIVQKQQEVAVLREFINNNRNETIVQVLYEKKIFDSRPSFKQSLYEPALSVIAEIKRKSPSRGLISPITDPVALAKRYIAGGARALSVLTDEVFFGGHIDDLIQISESAHSHSIPTLRKDFIIDKIQIAEAAASGASAVLCIVSVLGKKLKSMLEFANSINMDVLVEVHNENELNIAVECGAEIIGVNNRNLNHFSVTTDLSFEMLQLIPKNIIKVAESGITNPELAKQYYQAGFDAVLIGEALVTSHDPETFIRSCADA